MVQRKTCQAIESYNLQPKTRFVQEHLKILGPEMKMKMMMMKRTKPRRKIKDTVSQSGKPPPTQDLVAKVTGGSPNYMKGTTSSEARKEKKKRFNLSSNQKNQTGQKHDSRYGVNKERSNNKPSLMTVRGLRKSASFKRCSQRATCSSTLKDFKFPEYLMLNHGETDDQVKGTSVLKVCPYKYCSLNGHLHAQYPPLKSFISSKRRSLKSQKSAKGEAASKEDFVEKKGNGDTCEVDIVTQVSESVSEGAPRSEIDSDDYSDSRERVMFSEGEDGFELEESDFEETLVDDSVEETIQNRDEDADQSSCIKTCEIDIGTQISETVSEGAPPDETDSDGDHGIKLKESHLEKEIQANRDGDAESGMMKNSEADDAGEETLKDKAEDCKEEPQDQIEVISTIEETEKVPFNPCNKEESDDTTISWTIKCKKPVEETGDLREFNPREPSYLPIMVEADSEKVDLKHQDMDERKNSEDWMFDYALQLAVTKLAPARKRKVALLVEAFETVQPVLSYGRHLQVCN